MAIIVEDGTGVSGANSYVSLATLRAYAAARGLTLPTPDADCNVLLINSADFIETFRMKFKGKKTNAAQAMQWPRRCVYIDDDCEPIADTDIPDELTNAQCQMAYEAVAQTAGLQPTGTGVQVISEKVDVIETHYSDQGSNNIQPVYTKALGMLQPLLNYTSNFSLSSVRI